MTRLEDLLSYEVLDTEPEVGMDEIAGIAKSIFNTPNSVVSFLDDHRQWYKAKIGTDVTEVPLDQTICKYTLESSDEILVIKDPENDTRLLDNPHVASGNGIRFYVSAPIISPQGNVLGTVCTWDFRKHTIKDTQLEALKLLAKWVMISMETRKIMKKQGTNLELFGDKLKKLTAYSPGAFFKLKTNRFGKKIDLEFLSEGINQIFPELNYDTIRENPELVFQKFEKAARIKLLREFLESTNPSPTFELDITTHAESGSIRLLWIKIRTDIVANEIYWYGTIQDISEKIYHLASLEKILFDISHRIRSPLVKIKSLASIISEEKSPETILEMINHLSESANELDSCLHDLNSHYHKLLKELKESKK